MDAAMTADRHERTFVLSLVAMPGSDPIRAIRWLLKIALRRFKLRCIDVREELAQKESGA
jgi:hypothetical protein